RKSPGRTVVRRQRTTGPDGKVLRARVCAAGRGGHVSAPRSWIREARRRVFRQRSRVLAWSGGGAEGGTSRRLVRPSNACAKWVGLRTRLPEWGSGSRRRRGGQGETVHVCPGNHVPRSAPRHLQVPVQRDLSGGEDDVGGVEHERGAPVTSPRP